MRRFVLLTALVFLGVSETQAQTVSIVNMDRSRAAILLEARLTQLLRDNGYVVQGAGTEGYVVLLHGMDATTNQGVTIGVVGSATVARVLRHESAATLLPETRVTNQLTTQEFVEKFTAVMGSPVIYLAGTTAIGGDTETVAAILSIYITTVVQRSSAKPQEPLWTLEHGALKHSTASPIR